MRPVQFGTFLALISCLAWPATGTCAAESASGTVEILPAVSTVAVDGDDNKFREDWWRESDLQAGLERFILRRDLESGATVEVQGRILVPGEDYRLDLRIDKPQVGYVHAGYKEYRKYFDDTGGFFHSFSDSSYDLGKDLHLDIGKLFIEAGLTLPDRPKLVFGYEHRFKDGQKSLLEWGEVDDGTYRRKIYPSYKDIDEKLDVVRLEISHELANIRLKDQFRYEKYSLDTKRHDQELNVEDDQSSMEEIEDDYEHDAFFNTFQASTHLNDKVFLSMGYLFTSLDGDGDFSMNTVPGVFERDKFWESETIDLDQEVHIFSANAILGPFHETTVYLGLQGEILDSEGHTEALLTEVEGDDLDDGGTIESPEAVISSDQDKWGMQETLGVRYAGLPRTTVYAEGRWTQQDIELTERELEDAALELERDTDTRVRRQRYSIGFNSSPLRRVTLAARYRYSYRSNDYDHDVDDSENSYSAFILDQDFATDEVMAKVSFRPMPGLRTSLQYQFVTMDIDTDEDTDPETSIKTSDYDAHIYTASVTAMPRSGLFLTGLVSYQDVELKTVNLEDAPVANYEGDVLSLAVSAGLALDARTNLNLQYSYTLAENFEDFSDEGLPLGVENQRHAVVANLGRQLTDNLSLRLRYGFYSYDDEASDGSDNYTAHLIGASCRLVF